ncbi:xanthine dehydrogenase family protein subunit M [Bradyrhizobium sp.]|uniref:FAD binding domain-containing protein n=1 Tax=Bradyrhizobium sp. TaxID=376 RepID=UPI0023A360A5|nr:xanthine dehydrogenase family protein subunit M [Bradyrhizobium sp.]MDE2378087.1 xanthine dehydrogenase family protein subunit M [Bradyrhizobium sp.]
MTRVERYLVPRTIAEAAGGLRDGNVTIFAGGTDLMPQSKSGKAKFGTCLMNIRRIGELRGIKRTASGFSIGALTTITDLRDSPEIKVGFPALWRASDHFASDQIRNAATIGGNLANASPAGDTLVPLLVFDARVVLVSRPNGALQTRTIPMTEFLVGPGKTSRRPDELLTAVEMDAPPPGFTSRFFKFGTRPALDISTISIGLGAVRDGEKLRNVRVAIGAAAPTPIRAPHVEEALEGKVVDGATIAAAVSAADCDIRPISDLRASEWYRHELVHNMLERMLSDVGHG